MSASHLSWTALHHDIIDSTQDKLKSVFLGNPKINEGLLVWSSQQTNGYGRHGRTWDHAKGNLYFSFLVRPHVFIQNIGHISLMTGLAVSDALDRFLPETHQTLLKWPNDVLIEDKKCSGILIDVLDQNDNNIYAMAIGIGINIDTTPLKTATHMNKFTPENVTPEQILDAVCNSFSYYYADYKEYGFKAIKQSWIKKTYPKNTQVTVKHANNMIEGKFDTIDNYGNLIILSAHNKRTTISSGDVFV